MKQVQVLFAPAEYQHISQDALADTFCVVFDILRATSTIITALANGARAVIPADDIPEALEARRQRPNALLAGERDGVRINAALTGGVEFDLGNSPREFEPAVVSGRDVIITTTNGSRALRACAAAKICCAGSFLNLSATAAKIKARPLQKILLVCSGTGSRISFEDTLAAGAMVEHLLKINTKLELADSTEIALQTYLKNANNLVGAMKFARNGRRLLSIPELAADVPACLKRDVYSFTATCIDGVIRKD